MKFGALAGVCRASSQLVRFVVNKPESGMQHVLGVASGDKEYVGNRFVFYGKDEMIQHYGRAYFENFNTLAYLYDDATGAPDSWKHAYLYNNVAGIPNSERLDKIFKALELISLGVYAKYKSPGTFKKPASTLFENDYSSKAFNYIYKKRLFPDLQKQQSLDTIFLRKTFEFYSSFTQRLVEDRKVSRDAGMFPFQEMAMDLLKGLLFMSHKKPDEMNPLIGEVLECLVIFHYDSSRLYHCITLEKNKNAPVSKFQKEHFDSLCELADTFESLYDDFNRIMYKNPELFDSTEQVLIYTVNRFMALTSMMRMLSHIGYTVDPSGFLMIDKQFLEFLSKSVVHVILSSLETSICMKRALLGIEVPPNDLASTVLSSIKSWFSANSYYLDHSTTIENDLEFDSESVFELADLPRDELDKGCRQIIQKISSEFFKSVFDNNIVIQFGNSTIYDLLVELFAEMYYDSKVQTFTPFYEFIKKVQYIKLGKSDFKNTGTFAGMVDSALEELTSVSDTKRNDVKAYLSLNWMLDEIVRFSGVGLINVGRNTSMFQALTNAAEKAEEKKLAEGNKHQAHIYKMLVYSVTASFIISVCLFALLVLKVKHRSSDQSTFGQ